MYNVAWPHARSNLLQLLMAICDLLADITFSSAPMLSERQSSDSNRKQTPSPRHVDSIYCYPRSYSLRFTIVPSAGRGLPVQYENCFPHWRGLQIQPCRKWVHWNCLEGKADRHDYDYIAHRVQISLINRDKHYILYSPRDVLYSSLSSFSSTIKHDQWYLQQTNDMPRWNMYGWR